MKLKNLRLFGGRGIRSFSFWLTLGAAVIDIFALWNPMFWFYSYSKAGMNAQVLMILSNPLLLTLFLLGGGMGIRPVLRAIGLCDGRSLCRSRFPSVDYVRLWPAFGLEGLQKATLSIRGKEEPKHEIVPSPVRRPGNPVFFLLADVVGAGFSGVLPDLSGRFLFQLLCFRHPLPSFHVVQSCRSDSRFAAAQLHSRLGSAFVWPPCLICPGPFSGLAVSQKTNLCLNPKPPGTFRSRRFFAIFWFGGNPPDRRRSRRPT